MTTPDPSIVELTVRWNRLTGEVKLARVLPNKLEHFGLWEVGRQLAEDAYRRAQQGPIVLPEIGRFNGQRP